MDTRYSMVYETESDLESHTDSKEGLLSHERPVVRRSRSYRQLLSLPAAFFAGVILCFAALKWKDLGSPSPKFCNPTNSKPLKSTLVPEELNLYTETVRYNGTLDWPSIYRGSGPEVDQAWSDVVNTVGFIGVTATEDDIKELDTDRETLARFPEEDGGGYVMTIEFTHQIHCLNMLRRIVPYNYPKYQEEVGDLGPDHEKYFITHVDHCIEMLRQILMCHADTTPIFQNWVDIRSHPWPNFNTVHQCRNFNAIRDWAEARGMGEDTLWPNKPEGQKALATPP